MDTIEYGARVEGEPDFIFERHSTLFLCHPQNDVAEQHLHDEVATPETLWFGQALVVEQRYAQDLANRLHAEDWKVK